MAVEYFERQVSDQHLERVNRLTGRSWVYINGPGVDFAEIAAEFGLDQNIISDVGDDRELPRKEFKDDQEYIFMRPPVGDSDSSRTVPLLSIVGPKRLITIDPKSKFSPLEANSFLINQTPTSLLTANLAAIVSSYDRQIYDLTEKISSARKRLSRHEVKNADFVRFVAIEDALGEYQTNLECMLSVINQLIDNRHKLFKPRDIEALEDIVQHLGQLIVSIKSSLRTINSIQSAYSTIANNTLNHRMKILTSITILLAIPNVFYGMYGMNIALPIQNEWWAYPTIVGFTLVLTLLVYAIARRFRLF